MTALEGTTRTRANEQRFCRLAALWRSETELVSNVTKRILHPAYQKIIGMGEGAIPLILNDLSEHGPDDWFWALTAMPLITQRRSEFLIFSFTRKALSGS